MRKYLPAGLLVLCIATQGCGVSAYERASTNIDILMKQYAGPGESPGEGKPGAVAQAMKLPWVAARFCLDRADHNASSSRMSVAGDAALLIAASLTAGVGTAGYAASGLIEDSGKKRDWAQVGAVNIAGTAALLGLRTALDLGSVGREQRIAAADQVEGALAILQQAALELDSNDLILKSFQICGDGDRAIARVLGREDAGAKIERVIAEAKGAAKEAEAKKEVAQEKGAAALKELSTANESGDGASAAQAQRKLADADVEEAEANLLIARGAVAEARQRALVAGAQLRRAVLFYSNAEVVIAVADLDASHTAVVAAQNEETEAQKAVAGAKARRRKANDALLAK